MLWGVLEEVSTKVHAVTTTGGKPLHLEVMPGQQHESTMAEELLVHDEGNAFIADTDYDADRILANVRKLGMKPVIHSNPSRKRPLPLDRTRYRVECFFHDLKRFRAVAPPAMTRRRPATSAPCTSPPCFSGCVHQGQPPVMYRAS